MASSSLPSNNSTNPSFPPTIHSLPRESNPNSVLNTTFVQADPSSFRAVVQWLTGTAAPDKLPRNPTSGDMSPRRPAFKPHERRPTARNRVIKLNNKNINRGSAAAATSHSPFSSARSPTTSSGEINKVTASPISPQEYLQAAPADPKTPRSPMEEEGRATVKKGFHLHPSPLGTPRGSDPLELLPLFPLHSPRDNNNHHSSS